MTSRNSFVRAIVAASLSLPPAMCFAACEVHSGPKTAALVELYTSEGCSSCPPADQQLARLHEATDPSAEVVPLALHVGYWDYIGWKDPYAQPAFGDRQSRLVHANQRKTVYTPQFFVAGGEVYAWRRALREEVRRVNSQTAIAAIRLQASFVLGGMLAIHADASAHGTRDPVSLYVTVAENGLVSHVRQGENRGATLSHDHVAREWIDPTPLHAGVAQMQRSITLPEMWDRARLEVVAFVQDERSGHVLQAVSTRPCTGNQTM